MVDRELKTGGKLVFWVFRIIWTSVVIAVPTLGVWIGSSIAAYLNGPVWLVCLSGLLLFPGLPMLWEGIARMRRKKRKRWDKPGLTTWDAIVLRTLFINFVFLGALLWGSPQTAFTALSTRGDWITDGLDHPVAEAARPWFFRAADGLVWLYEAANDNEYEDLVDDAVSPDDRPAPTSHEDEENPWENPWEREDSGANEEDSSKPTPREDSDTRAETETPPPEEKASPEQVAKSTPGSWPQPHALHPLIATIPDAARASPQALGEYIRANESDPYRRVRAIHDFVADHVAYDAPAYRDGRYPPQDADTVFRTGLGVCAGYANLAKAIGDASGDDIVVVVGDARTRGGEVSGEGHAWNAAYVEGRWHLFDATWDSGSIRGREFIKEYSSSYLWVPPELMGITHFPEDPAWQLRKEALSRGEFGRQPMMRPRFFAQRFSLRSPKRSQVTVDRAFEMELGNPERMYVLASFEAEAPGNSGDDEKKRCRIANADNPKKDLKLACDFPSDGTYHVSLFSSRARYGSYDFLGEIVVNAQG